MQPQPCIMCSLSCTSWLISKMKSLVYLFTTLQAGGTAETSSQARCKYVHASQRRPKQFATRSCQRLVVWLQARFSTSILRALHIKHDEHQTHGDDGPSASATVKRPAPPPPEVLRSVYALLQERTRSLVIAPRRA